MRILELTSDVVFKSFMLSEATRKYKARLIHAITDLSLDLLLDATYTSEELKVNHGNEKVYRTDIVVIVKNHILSIEMNDYDSVSLRKKNALYGSNLLSQQLEQGENYDTLKKVIQINLDTNNHYKKAISKFLMKEATNNEEEHDFLIDYHINLSKLNGKCYNEIDKLCQIFLTKDSSKIKGVDQDMDDAINELERISSDNHIIGLYDVEKVQKKLYNSLVIERDQAVARFENYKKEAKKAAKETLKENIKRMKSLGLDDEIITKSLGITIDELKNLI